MKQTITKHFLLIVILLAVGFAFAMKATVFQKQPDNKPKPADTISADFSRYWGTGKVEINPYRLEQAYNGALHAGEARLIFSQINFRTDSQMKTEHSTNAVPTMQMILSKTFTTGVANYALSTSVFTPVGTLLFPNTLKVTNSIQTIDGHSYLQINYRNNAYQVSGQSYLENEAEENYTLSKVMLEDELWNRIRINPDKLPMGETQLIPGTMTARMRHKPLEPLPAKTTLADYEGVLYPGQFLKSYTIEYPTDDRTLIIIFENHFPHTIVGWEETYDSKDNLLTSRAVLMKSTESDFRTYHLSADSALQAKSTK
jgi:hypothetical protein